jgi:deazaflavin-dependent oxidoreductase (nitroreductase family)
MDLRHRLNDVGLRNISRAHRAVLRATGGRVGGSAMGMPMVQLCTTGRRSGRPRWSILAAPVIDGDRVVLVASKGGDDRDPDWFRNLLAQPDVELIVNGQRRALRARRASPDEKADLWPRVVAAHRGYAAYQRRTKRDIPLVICDPR